jgi:hypothetical protein
MKIDFILIQELYTNSATIDRERSRDKPQPAANEDRLHKASEEDSLEHGSDYSLMSIS